jgi:hypothetical protein
MFPTSVSKSIPSGGSAKKISPASIPEMQTIKPKSVIPEPGKYYHICYKYDKGTHQQPEELVYCIKILGPIFRPVICQPLTSNVLSLTSDKFVLRTNVAKECQIKEVPVRDLPLYVGWKYNSVEFETLLRTLNPV